MNLIQQGGRKLRDFLEDGGRELYNLCNIVGVTNHLADRGQAQRRRRRTPYIPSRRMESRRSNRSPLTSCLLDPLRSSR